MSLWSQSTLTHRATRGATLRTYFIGQCLIQFANAYSRWRTQQYQRILYGDTDDLQRMTLANTDVMTARLPDPEATASDRDTIDWTLSQLDSGRAHAAFVMTASGHSHREIGEQLGVTEKAVERLLQYQRGKAQKFLKRSVA